MCTVSPALTLARPCVVAFHREEQSLLWPSVSVLARFCPGSHGRLTFLTSSSIMLWLIQRAVRCPTAWPT